MLVFKKGRDGEEECLVWLHLEEVGRKRWLNTNSQSLFDNLTTLLQYNGIDTFMMINGRRAIDISTPKWLQECSGVVISQYMYVAITMSINLDMFL